MTVRDGLVHLLTEAAEIEPTLRCRKALESIGSARRSSAQTPPGRLSPSTPDYETIGEVYADVLASLIEYADAEGPEGLVAQPERQLCPGTARLPGLRVVRTIEEALAAVETIVEQGETLVVRQGQLPFLALPGHAPASAMEAANAFMRTFPPHTIL